MTEEPSARGAKGKFLRYRKALARIHSSAETGMAKDAVQTFLMQKFGVGVHTARNDVLFLEGLGVVAIRYGIVTITDRGRAVLDGGRFPGEA